MKEFTHFLTTEQQTWIINSVGIENIKYDFENYALTFLKDEDAVAFKLVFGDRRRKQEVDASFYYCPYIPLYHTNFTIKIV